jgi:hypothetical protein
MKTEEGKKVAVAAAKTLIPELKPLPDWLVARGLKFFAKHKTSDLKTFVKKWFKLVRSM